MKKNDCILKVGKENKMYLDKGIKNIFVCLVFGKLKKRK